MRSHLLVLALVLAAVGSVAAQPRQTSPAVPHYRAGMQLLAHEYWNDAAAAFKRAIAADDRFALAYYGLGRAEMGRKDYRAAISALLACRDLFIKDAGLRATRELGAMQRRQEQINELRYALREQQSGPQTVAQQRVVQEIQNQISDLESRGLASDLEMQAVAPAFVSLSLGSAYFRSGSLAEAETAYLDALKANPRMGEAYNNLAVVYMMSDRLVEAERAVRQAERNGYRVNPGLKDELRARRGGTRSR
jgi:tetratricopeptide (TPR) repeat protein